MMSLNHALFIYLKSSLCSFFKFMRTSRQPRNHSFSRPVQSNYIISPRRNQRKSLFYRTSIDDYLKCQVLKPMVSHDIVVRDIENDLNMSLIGLNDKWDIFNQYKMSFDKLISNFGTRSKPMIKIKNELDQFINFLKSQNESDFEKIENAQKSIDEFSENLVSEKEKLQTKRANMQSLLSRINSINSDLSQEIEDLNKQIRQLILTISEKTSTVNDKVFNLQYLKSDYFNAEERFQNAKTKNHQLQKQMEDLQETLKIARTEMKEKLEAFYQSRNNLTEKEKLSSALTNSLSEYSHKMDSINQEFGQKSQENSELLQRLSSINEQITLMNNDQIKFLKAIHILETLRASDEKE